MSTTIDQRVVEMRFDNQNFERNVSSTMSALDKLKQSLRFTGATKGFEDVSTAARRVDLSGLGGAVETVGLKFSAMYTIADQAFRNITNSAMRTGERIISALAIDPIKTGFAEYETQIGAVQTILANTQSKGTTLGDVNKALDELNTYADKTIYNFTEMTRNIGTFTAAGVDLDKSVTSIKGIANLAAVSGSTSQQASTAMYQLSQALAAGKVQLMDWNSVVNAGMGGQVFQDALKRTAENMGKNVDAMIEKYGSFRESLTKGEWLTADVLTETLTQLSGAYSEADLLAKGYTADQTKEILKLADTAVQAATKVKTFSQLWDTLKESAQSGWTQTWEIMVGDFEEAKEFLTKVSDTIGGMIGASSDRRNAMLSGGLDSNWKKLITTINDAGIETSTFEEKIRKIVNDDAKLDGLIEEYGTLGNVFKEGALSSDILTKAIDGLGKSTADLSLITGELKKGNIGEEVKQAQQALSDLGYDLGKSGVDSTFGTATEAAVKAFQEANKLEATGIIDEATLAALEKATGDMTDLSTSCKDFISNITELGGRENIIQSLWNVFDGLLSVVKPIKDAFTEIFPPMTAEQLFNFTEKLKDFTSKLVLSGEQSTKLKSTFKGLFAGVDVVFTVIKQIGGGILDILGQFTWLGDAVLGTTGSLGDWLANLSESIKESNVFGNAIDKVVGFLTNAIIKLKEFTKSVKDSFAAKGYSGFVGFLKLIWDFVSKIGSALTGAFTMISDNLLQVFGGSYIDNLINTGLFTGLLLGLKKVVTTMQEMIEGGQGSADGIKGFFGNVTGIIDDVRGCFETFQTNLKAETLSKIAKAIALVAASVFVIALIDPERLEASLGAMAVLFAELMFAMSAFTKISAAGVKGGIKASALMISMSTAVLILAAALKTLSTVDPDGMMSGLIAVGVLMAEMSIFLRTAEFDGKVGRAAVGIVLISSAMLILAKAVEDFSSMSVTQLTKGVAAIGALLAELAIFSNFTSKSKGMLSTGASMVLLGTSMKIFASAVKDFANMRLDELERGLAAMAIALTSVAIAMRIMPKNMLSIGAGFTIISASMLILAQAVKSFSGMTWDEIGRGLTVMGIALAELAIALKFMQGSVSGSAALIIAAGALAIMAPVLKLLGGMTVGEIAKSLITLAGAFAVIGVAGMLLSPLLPTILGLAGAFALFSISILGIGIGLSAVATGFTALAVAGAAGATAIVSALSIIIVGIADLIPQLARKLGEGIVEVARVVGEHAPVLAESVLKLVVEVLRALEEYTPQIVDSLGGFLIGVLDALSGKLPELIKSAVNVIQAFFQGVIDALSGIDTTNLLKGIAGVALMSGLMWVLSSVAALIPGAMVGVLGMGAVIAELSLVLAAIGALAQIPGLDWLIAEGGNFLQTIGTAIGQFFGGIAGGIAEGVSAVLPQIGSDLSAFMTNVTPFIEGAKMIDASMMEGVKALAETILILTAADLVNGIASWISGGSSLGEFGTQLANLGEDLRIFTEKIGVFGPEQVATAANAAAAIAAIAKAAQDIPNEGGWAAKLLGDNSIAAFGEKLPDLGSNLSSFVTNLGTFTNDQVNTVDCAANAIGAIADAAGNIDGQADWAKKLFGDNSLASFGEQMAGLGANLSNFAKNLGTFNDAKVATVNSAVKAIKAIATLADANLKGAKNNLSGFGDKIVGFGKDLASFCGELPASESLTSAVNNLKKILAVIDDIAKANNDAILKFADSLKTLGEDGVDSFVSAFTNENAKTDVKQAIVDLVQNGLDALKTKYQSFYDSGAYLATGFANGISANTYKAKAKAKAMAAAAAAAARKELDEHSPSRVGYEIGDFFGIAFVNGISDSVSKAYKASSEMAISAKDGLGSAIGKIADVVESNIDSQPTIRPILDLSDIKNGINTMSGLFNSTQSVGVLADISAISASMNGNQNGLNDDIVYAIDKLSRKMDNVRGDTYNLNGITYSEGTELAEAIQTIVRHAKLERRM